jgi:hypothetical protein
MTKLLSNFIYHDPYNPARKKLFEETKIDGLDPNVPNTLLRNKYTRMNGQIIPKLQPEYVQPTSNQQKVEKINEILEEPLKDSLWDLIS